MRLVFWAFHNNKEHTASCAWSVQGDVHEALEDGEVPGTSLPLNPRPRLVTFLSLRGQRRTAVYDDCRINLSSPRTG